MIVTVKIMREYGSELDYFENDEIIQDSWAKFAHCNFLRCGRDAVMASSISLKNDCNIKTVWVPALSCISMYQNFVESGYNIRFYPIDEKFNPQLDDNLQYRESAILFMLYFGVTDYSVIKKFIEKHKECISIVDITHTVWNADTYNIRADILIGSIRKSVGIVNGGIYLSNKFAIETNKKTNRFTLLRREAFNIKNNYNATLDSSDKERYRNLFSEAELSLEKEKGVYCAEKNSIKALKVLNVKELQFKRIRNYEILKRLICDTNIVKPIVGYLNAGAIPFSMPILVDKQTEIQKSLADIGVYAPVLWPISKEAKQICPFSKKISENMLSLPIDQRYSTEDMYTIAERVKKVIYEQ